MRKPSVVFPFHDPDGIYFGHLREISPLLRQTFSEAFLSIPPSTRTNCPANVHWLESDPFFKLCVLPGEMSVGNHFLALFEFAAAASQPDQVLHLCFIDRLVFALRSHHRDQFMRDMATLAAEQTPFIFRRSQKAWDTHPRNYAQAEKIVTMVGELLFGEPLDYAWCHLAMQASWMRHILPLMHKVQNDDMSLMAEVVLHSRAKIRTRDVDWLEWEDPFFAAQDAEELKRQREASHAETQKRLRYVLPMVQKMVEHARNTQ